MLLGRFFHFLILGFSLLSPVSLLAGLVWSGLPDIPDRTGLAGSFAGVADGSLVVAGGSNFSNGAPWAGGTKIWHHRIFILNAPDSIWREAGQLPRALAHGVSITTPRGLLCIGGSDSNQFYADCFLLHFVEGELAIEHFPSMPRPLANMSGVLVGTTVFIVGGITTAADTSASSVLLTFDLNQPARGWKELPPLPGAGRILPVVGVSSGSFYVFSGAALSLDRNGQTVRDYLRDAWSYNIQSGWKRLADLPHPVVAAPSPAMAVGLNHLLVVGGDDGTKFASKPKLQHPGFNREIISYNVVTNTWAVLSAIPKEVSPPVVVPMVTWRGKFVLPSGEIRPAVRTTQVFAVTPFAAKTSFGWINWTVVAVYLAGMICTGFWFMKREAGASTEVYFRGGQRVPAWVAGMSIFATMLSSLTFMGIPARVYQSDASWYIGQLPILLVVPLVIHCYLPFFRKLNLTSAYEYLEQRFNLPCRLFASFSFMLLQLGRIAIVLYLPALALAAVSDIDLITSIFLIGILCIIYTVIGGIEAVVWTDAIQALVLMAGALLCLSLTVLRVDGGLNAIAKIATQDGKLFESLRWDTFSLVDGTTSAIVLFIAFAFNTLISYTSSQDVVQRYVTTPDIAAARQSLWLTMWTSVFAGAVFFIIGVAIYAFYKTHPQLIDPAMATSDSILPYYIMQQLPVGISGLVIAAIFAASQSTISSSLNSMATAYIKDLDERVLRPGRDDRTYLRAAQFVVVIAGILSIVVAVWMANSNIESAFKSFNTLIGLTAGPLGGLFALGVFTRHANSTGGLAGVILAFFVLIYLNLAGAPIAGLLYGFIGFAVTFIGGFIISLIFQGKGDRSLSFDFFKARP